MADVVAHYIKTHSKSTLLGFFLTLLFGPLGLFYSNWVAALILSITAIGLGFTVIIPIVCWILAIILNFFTVHKYNEKVKATAALSATSLFR